MKYSLRSLMIVAILGPPFLAWGWAGVKREMDARTLELVYPGGHPVISVNWQTAVAKVEAQGIGKLQAKVNTP